MGTYMVPMIKHKPNEGNTLHNARHLRVAKNDISGLWEFRVDSRLISAHETYTGAEDRLYSYDLMYTVQGITTEIVLDTRGI